MVRSLISKLDQPGTQNPSGNIHVVYLKNADATKLATTLRAAMAAEAGAEIVKPAQDAFWGGYSGYFRDPDGFYWEVAWNPQLPLGR